MFYDDFCAFGRGQGARTFDFVFNVLAPSGKATGPTNHIFYSIFAPSEKAKGPTTTLYFTMYLRLGKGRSGKYSCMSYWFAPSQRAESPKALFFGMFLAQSKRAKGPTTLYFTIFSPSLQGAKLQKTPCVLQCIRVLERKAGGKKTWKFTAFSCLRKGRGNTWFESPRKTSRQEPCRNT